MKIKAVKQIETGTDEVKPGYPEEFFEQILAFLGYGFCKSHAISYAMYSAVGLWLKAHYPLEFLCANLTVTDRAKENKGVKVLAQRVKYAQSLGFKIFPPDVRYAGSKWTIHEEGLMPPLNNIKGFGDGNAQVIIDNRPFNSAKDFLQKTKFTKSKFEALLFAGALDCFGEREYLYNWYNNDYLKTSKKKKKDNQMSFFCDEEEAVEITESFSKGQLEEAFAEMNGFSIAEPLAIRYQDLFKQGVKSIAEVNSGKTNKHFLLLCKIDSVTEFVSKSGTEFVKLELTDGKDSVGTVMRKGNYQRFKSRLAEKSVIVLPCQLGNQGGFFVDDLDKKEVKVLERS